MNTFDVVDANLTEEADRNAIRETVSLLAVPGMCESIKAGMAQLPDDLAKSLDW